MSSGGASTSGGGPGFALKFWAGMAVIGLIVASPLLIGGAAIYIASREKKPGKG